MFRTYKNPDDLEILLPEKVWEQIQVEVKKYYPNECGGILTGYINPAESTATVENMFMPAKVISNPVFFKRMASTLNKLLLQLFERTKGESYYLGEWHSHPNNAPYPSDTDLSTMQKILSNGHTTVKTPLLLIVGYDDTHFNERFFILFNNKLIAYEQEK